jgi:predicted RNase H-like HicB family nuclease
MNLKVKLLIYWDDAERIYYSCCPALLNADGIGKTIDEVIISFKESVKLYVQNRDEWFEYLKENAGCNVNKDELFPLNYTDETIISFTESILEEKIKTYKIVTIDLNI